MSDVNRAWTWRHLICKSDLPATTRHVLLTLSCFMNEVGGGCYPTQEQLAAATGLSDRAVRTHLEQAETKGWLKRNEHGFRGQRWRNTEYWALWPDLPHVDEGAEPRSGPLDESSGTTFRKVRNQVPTILPDSSNTPISPKAPTAGETPDVETLVRISSALQPELYRLCCAKSGHSPGLLDKAGGWLFSIEIISDAEAEIAGDLP